MTSPVPLFSRWISSSSLFLKCSTRGGFRLPKLYLDLKEADFGDQVASGLVGFSFCLVVALSVLLIIIIIIIIIIIKFFFSFFLSFFPSC